MEPTFSEHRQTNSPFVDEEMLNHPPPALIGICVASLSTTHAPTPTLDHLEAAAAEAQARLIEETEEWEIADEEGGDGGEAVKLPSINQMHADKSFEQGMRRADKADEKNQRRGRGGGGGYGGGYGGSHGGRGGGRGGYAGNSQNDFPSLQPSRGGPGVTQFHSANEGRGREMVARDRQQGNYTPPHLRGGGNDGARGSKNGSEASKKEENVPLPEQMKNRLKILDDDEADYYSI